MCDMTGDVSKESSVSVSDIFIELYNHGFTFFCQRILYRQSITELCLLSSISGVMQFLTSVDTTQGHSPCPTQRGMQNDYVSNA
jgi:hypothetical protein